MMHVPVYKDRMVHALHGLCNYYINILLNAWQFSMIEQHAGCTNIVCRFVTACARAYMLQYIDCFMQEKLY